MRRRILVKLLSVKFSSNPFIGSRLVICGRKDRHGEADGRISHVLVAVKLIKRAHLRVTVSGWSHPCPRKDSD
jgi:hypothetical protein